MFLTLLPAMAVGAQFGFPPNTVVSEYFDPRYGEVADRSRRVRANRPTRRLVSQIDG